MVKLIKKTMPPGKRAALYSVILCFWGYNSDTEAVAADFGENVAVHTAHKLTADEKTETVAFLLLSIRSAPEGVKFETK